MIRIAFADAEGDGARAQTRLVDDDVVAHADAPALEQLLEAVRGEARDLAVEARTDETEEVAAALEIRLHQLGVGGGERLLRPGDHRHVAVARQLRGLRAAEVD